VKSGIFLGGFLGNSQDTRINLLITSMSRGLDAKHEVFFHLRSGTNARVQGGGKKLGHKMETTPVFTEGDSVAIVQASLILL
jgi:hypothetical protein